MKTNEEMPVIEACPMNDGDDAHSYAQNSDYQKMVVDASKQLIQQVIQEELDLNSMFLTNGLTNPTFRMADFGCSVGPNTFVLVHSILEAVRNNTTSSSEKQFECQVFFSDQTNNDFNTLFRALPAHQENSKYFAAGVPGSFYSRLFPTASLHFGCISTALHWLSRVPQGMSTSTSTSIYCTGSDEQVAKAYSSQFARDMDVFFDARGEEIVSGGLLAISALCLPDGAISSEIGMGMSCDLLATCLLDAAKLGFISEERVESFYLPMYFPKVEELEAAVRKNGQFSVERRQKMARKEFYTTNTPIQDFVRHLRSVMENLIKQHFKITTQHIMDSIFDHMADKYSDNISAIMSPNTPQHVEVFILAKRL